MCDASAFVLRKRMGASVQRMFMLFRIKKQTFILENRQSVSRSHFMFSFHFSRKAAVIAAALVIGSASLFAEPITFEAGLFGTFDMNIGTQDVYVKENAWGADDFSNQMKFGYGGTVFFGAKNILVQNLGARVECGYLLNNGENFLHSMMRTTTRRCMTSITIQSRFLCSSRMTSRRDRLW